MNNEQAVNIANPTILWLCNQELYGNNTEPQGN